MRVQAPTFNLQKEIPPYLSPLQFLFMKEACSFIEGYHIQSGIQNIVVKDLVLNHVRMHQCHTRTQLSRTYFRIATGFLSSMWYMIFTPAGIKLLREKNLLLAFGRVIFDQGATSLSQVDKKLCMMPNSFVITSIKDCYP